MIGAKNFFLMRHLILGVVCHCSLGFDTFYQHAKFDDSSFSRLRDIIGASTFKVDHVTMARSRLLNGGLSSLC